MHANSQSANRNARARSARASTAWKQRHATVMREYRVIITTVSALLFPGDSVQTLRAYRGRCRLPVFVHQQDWRLASICMSAALYDRSRDYRY